VTPQNTSHVRIAIGGDCLDEVRIRQARWDVPGSVSYPSFPAHRHRARIEGYHVLVTTQAAAVVKLFADGVLPAIGVRAVTVTVGSHQLGPCLLEAVETGDATPIDTTIALRFLRVGEGGS
jgi:hypothetical protein